MKKKNRESKTAGKEQSGSEKVKVFLRGSKQRVFEEREANGRMEERHRNWGGKRNCNKKKKNFIKPLSDAKSPSKSNQTRQVWGKCGTAGGKFAIFLMASERAEGFARGTKNGEGFHPRIFREKGTQGEGGFEGLAKRH